MKVSKSPDHPLIRAAKKKDWGTIYQIYNKAILTTTATFDCVPLNKKQMEEKLRHYTEGKHCLKVVELNGQIVGWGGTCAWSRRDGYKATAEVSVYIQNEYHGLGFGKAIIHETLRTATEKQLHTLIAFITEGNSASIHLFKQFGFKEGGAMREVAEKFDRRHDLLIFQKIIGAPIQKGNQ